MLSTDLYLTTIYFIYGLAFFSMGLLILMEVWRAPALAEARVLLPLAIFGFVHGIHEWVEMATLVQRSSNLPAFVGFARLVLLAGSFCSLIIFGLCAMRSPRGYSSRGAVLLGVGLASLNLFMILLASLTTRNEPWHWLSHADALSRYLLAVPGAALAALALLRQAKQALAARQRRLANGFRVAGTSFAVYSLAQLFVPQLEFFPANLLNSLAFLNLTGIPIQLVRAVAATAITYGMIQAVRAAEAERQHQFLAMQQSRLEALEQVQRELLERAALRQQLFRQIITAQEEERARIARELHDETAQYLTALSLNLATLRTLIPDTPHVLEMLERGQSLLNRISQSIYRLVRSLRPAQLDDLGLGAALQALAGEMQTQVGLPISLEISATRERLDPLVETALYRVAQEALANAARHAHCQKATLRLSSTPEEVILQVQDDGVGFDPQQSHLPGGGLGLAGMRERAQSIGARLFISSKPGSGTLVEIRAPKSRSPHPTIEEDADETHPDHVG